MILPIDSLSSSTIIKYGLKTDVKRLYQMQESGVLLFPAINVNDSFTKSKLRSVQSDTTFDLLCKSCAHGGERLNERQLCSAALLVSSASMSLAGGFSGAVVGRLDRRQWRHGAEGGSCRRHCRRLQHDGQAEGRVAVEGGISIGIGHLLLCLRIPSVDRRLLRRQESKLEQECKR